MKKGHVKFILYLASVVSVCVFGFLFRHNYSRMIESSASAGSADLTDVQIPEYKNPAMVNSRSYHLGLFGAAFFASALAFSVLFARDVSKLIGAKTVKALYNDEGDGGIANPVYEQAEQEWANGNHLEAIRMLREYLNENPREQHVAIRIAEIYEKDLNNPLAAALEYEEILKQKLAAERWGWAAIHLCNLYSKLIQPEKALALLRRIDAEYGQTAAAEKARKRLALFESPGAPTLSEESAPVSEESGPS